MCVRLNNLSQIKDLLRYFFDESKSMLRKHYSKAMDSKLNSASNLLYTVHIRNEAYITETLSNKVSSKIEGIKLGLLKLLAFRFNAFCKHAKTVILTAELSSYPIEIRIKPLVEFLSCNLDMLKIRLYPQILNKFLKILWDFFLEVKHKVILFKNLRKY